MTIVNIHVGRLRLEAQLCNKTTPQNRLTLVENCSLAGGNGRLRQLKNDLGLFVVNGNEPGRGSLMTVADTRADIYCCTGFCVDPVYVRHHARLGQRVLLESHNQAVVLRIDADNVIRFFGRAVDAASLADGKQVQSGMLADNIAPGVLDGPGGCIEPGLLQEKVTVLILMDEADILALPGGDRFKA